MGMGSMVLLQYPQAKMKLLESLQCEGIVILRRKLPRAQKVIKVSWKSNQSCGIDKLGEQKIKDTMQRDGYDAVAAEVGGSNCGVSSQSEII